MTTQYTHNITIAVPENLVENTNHLAAIIGESPADINTFSACRYQDANENLYVVANFAAKPSVLNAATILPETPPFADPATDRTKAQAALNTLGQPGGIMMIVDMPPTDALDAMGLTRIEAPGF